MASIGDHIWIPCEVKPGAFSNERLVLLQSPNDEWLGFVQEYSLKDRKAEGEDSVKGEVVNVNCEELTARIFGEPLSGSAFYKELIERINSYCCCLDQKSFSIGKTENLNLNLILQKKILGKFQLIYV